MAERRFPPPAGGVEIRHNASVWPRPHIARELAADGDPAHGHVADSRLESRRLAALRHASRRSFVRARFTFPAEQSLRLPMGWKSPGTAAA